MADLDTLEKRVFLGSNPAPIIRQSKQLLSYYTELFFLLL